jgi:hypothetical protein
MKDLRERCFKFLQNNERFITTDDLETFAREIRNEALEEAAELFQGYSPHDLKKVLAAALAAHESEEKGNG